MIRPRFHRSLFFLFILLSCVVLVRSHADAGGVPGGCGNGLPDPGELCDDGNNVSGDGCSATCQIEFAGACCLPDPCSLTDAACAAAGGTNLCSLLYGEFCAAAGGTFQGAFTGCDPNPCVSCGDGAVNQASEQCDDGNTNDGDGCSSTCQDEFCGDGAINNACEICPPAEGVVCALLAPCLNEQCDDSNTDSGDGCSSLCQVEFCGDGTINNACGMCAQAGECANGTPCLNEQCDDGNTTDGDGCSSDCQNEDTCAEACASPLALHVNARNAVLIGTAGDDILCGDDRNNVLRGMAGDDILCGFGGNDTLYGHLGDDYLDGGEGDDNLRAEEGDDTVVGGPGNDAIFGHEGTDDLDGGPDNDTIRGGAGNDTMEGGPGSDILNGEGGTDTCTGGETTTNCP